MTRILMFVPQYPYPVVGGLEKQAHELAKTLIAKGISVRVISGQNDSGNRGVEIVEGVPVFRIFWSDNRLLRYLIMPLDIIWTMIRIRKESDVIHIHQFSPVSLFIMVLSIILRKPVLAKLPNVGDFGLPGLRNTIFGKLRLFILLQSSSIVAMSSESFRELQEYGYPSDRVLQVPNGISLKKDLKKNSTVTHSEPPCHVVFVGRLSEEKRVSDLIYAWKIARQRCQFDAILNLYGDGPLLAELESEVLKLNLSDSVFFRGHVDDVASLLSNMDVFVLVSEFEGNSNAILEAMTAGLPVVATRVGGTPMLVGEYGKPFLCDPGDHENIALTLITLITNQQLRNEVGEAMRKRINDHFSLDMVAECYICAYQLLKNGRNDKIHQCGDKICLE